MEKNKLPSTRRLSTLLNVSRNTIESTYLQLSSEGYVSSKAGSGFIVEKLDNSIISKLKKEDIKTVKNIALDVIHNSNNNAYTYNDGYNYKYNFEYGKLSAPDFPLRLWKRISNKCLSAISAEDMVSYKAGKGEQELQIEIINHLRKSRGVSCSSEQIIISSGMEYCLSLLCQLFRDDFDKVALEDPGYIGAKDIFINNGLTEKELINKAKNHGVKVYPVSVFWIREDKYPNNIVLLGFGGMAENDIVEGTKLLKKAWLDS